MSARILILDFEEPYRGYLLDASHRLGLDLYFVLPKPIEGLVPHTKGVLILPNLYTNPTQWTQDVVDFAREHRIDAIMTNEDDLVELAAWACARRGLPSPSPESIRLANDKWATRDRLSQASVPGPAYECVTSLSQAQTAVDRIGLPVVVKPIGCSGAVGASKVLNAAGLDIAWRYAYAVSLRTPPEYHKIIIEEYMPGPLISVEAAVIEGMPTCLTVTDCLQFEVVDRESCYYFIHQGPVLPSTLDDKAAREMMTLTERAIQALDIETGIVHTELKSTPDGGKVVEINARLPGMFVPELVHRALGVDWAGAAMLLALGQKPDLTIRHHKGAAVQLIVPKATGTVVSVSGFDKMATAPHVERAVLWTSEGQHVAALTENVEERLGYVLTEHVGPREALSAAQQAQQLLSVMIREDGDAVEGNASR